MVEGPFGVQEGQVEHAVANGYAYTRCRGVWGREDAVREVLDGKRALRIDVEERGGRRISRWVGHEWGTCFRVRISGSAVCVACRAGTVLRCDRDSRLGRFSPPQSATQHHTYTESDS